MTQATHRQVCEACGRAARGNVQRDSAGNLLCAECARALRGGVEPPPELSMPSGTVPEPLAPTPPLSYSRRDTGTPSWADFWDFKWMIAPMVIRGAFVLGTICCIALGFIGIIQGMGWGTVPGTDRWAVLSGFLFMVFGPVILRLAAESLIVFFKIHSALESMDRKMGDV